MATVATGEKIKRELFVTLIKAPTENAKYEYIGEDLEEFNIEMNADVETKKNILGNNSISVKSYDKQGSVDPYVAVKGSDMFNWLTSIVEDDKKLDEVKTKVVNVKLYETATAGKYPASEEEVCVEVTSYGGDTSGLQIAYNLHFTGKKKKGTFDPETLTFAETTVEA